MANKYRPDYNDTNDYFEQASVNPNTISNEVSTIGNNFYTSTSPTEDNLIDLDNDLMKGLHLLQLLLGLAVEVCIFHMPHQVGSILSR